MSSLAKLYVVVGAKTDEFEKALSKMQKNLQNVSQRMGDFGKTMSMKVTAPAVALGAGLVALAGKMGATADRLLDLSDITGMSTKAIQEYQHVAKMAGVSTEAVTNAAEGLIRRLPQIEKEGGQVADAFRALGVSLRDASGNMRSSDAIMDDMLYSLARMEDTASRNALGAQVFGGAWKDIAPILGMGEEGIKAAREEAERLGLVLGDDALQGANEFRQGMDRVKASLGGVFNEVGAKLAPVLSNELLPVIEERLVPALRNLGERLANLIEWFTNLDPKWQAVIAAAAGFLVVLGPVLIVVGAIIGAIGNIIPLLATLAKSFVFLLSPVGLVIAAVAAAVAIGWYLYNNWDEIRAKIGALFDRMRQQIEQTWNNIKGFIFNIGDQISGVFNDLVNRAWNWGRNLISNFVNGIKAMWSSLVDTLSSVGDIVAGFLGFRSPTKLGPGRDADKWAPNFMEMYAKGFRVNMPKVHVEMEKVLAEPVPGLASVTNNTTNHGGRVHIENLNVNDSKDFERLLARLGVHI